MTVIFFMILKNLILRTIFLILGLTLVNFFVSFILVKNGFVVTENYFPAGFGFGWFASISIFILGGFCIYKLKLFQQFPLITAIIIAGAISNFLEYAIFGFVIDYINIGIAVLNLADLEIYGGLVLLNWKIITKK